MMLAQTIDFDALVAEAQRQKEAIWPIGWGTDLAPDGIKWGKGCWAFGFNPTKDGLWTQRAWDK